MRQWPNDPTVAHLIFVDHHEVPSAASVDTAVRHASRRGARAVRTSALFPKAADAVLGCGFEPLDRLALLRRGLRDLSVVDDVGELRATRPMLPWQHRAAAAVDRAAFGPLWANDATSLRDIRRATPQHRARVVHRNHALVGFAISGGAGDHGYLQRLAVDPVHRRQGIATALVLDALSWMRAQQLTTVLVNTGRTNEPALRLYESIGFERLEDELVIAELRLR